MGTFTNSSSLLSEGRSPKQLFYRGLIKDKIWTLQFYFEDGQEHNKDAVKPIGNPVKKVHLMISRLSFCLIDNWGKEKREVLHIGLQQIDFLQVEYAETVKQQFRIKMANIDNNYQQQVWYPVLLTPSKPKSITEGDVGFLNLIMEKTAVKPTFPS